MSDPQLTGYDVVLTARNQTYIEGSPARPYGVRTDRGQSVELPAVREELSSSASLRRGARRSGKKGPAPTAVGAGIVATRRESGTLGRSARRLPGIAE